MDMDVNNMDLKLASQCFMRKEMHSVYSFYFKDTNKTFPGQKLCKKTQQGTFNVSKGCRIISGLKRCSSFAMKSLLYSVWQSCL